MSGPSWWEGRLVGLDLETTSPLPEEARIVTAAIVVVGGGQPTEERSWVVDPGVEVPEEAAAIHGFTTERVRAEGRPPSDVLREVLQEVLGAVQRGLPLVIFNARYDLTVLDRESRRHLGSAGGLPERLRVVDPLVLDKHLDRYRKSYPYGHNAETAAAAGIPSSRTLGGMVKVYSASLDGAHEATADALAAARIAYRIGQRGRVIRRTRSRAEAVELRMLEGQWAMVRDDLDELHAYQRDLALAERVRFAEYKASIGEHEEAERIRAEVGWPVLELRPEGVVA